MTRYLHNKNNIFTNMHIILSPAKTMAGTSKIKAPAGTTPRFNQEAIEIALHMAQYPAEELGRMLKLSPKLMLESYHRFQNFHSAEEEPLQALLAYTGSYSRISIPKILQRRTSALPRIICGSFPFVMVSFARWT